MPNPIPVTGGSTITSGATSTAASPGTTADAAGGTSSTTADRTTSSAPSGASSDLLTAADPNRGGILTSGSADPTQLTSAGADADSSTTGAATPGTASGAPDDAGSSSTTDSDRLEPGAGLVTLPRTGPTAKTGATAAATIVGLLGLAAARLRRRVEDETRTS